MLALALAAYGFCAHGCRDQYPDEVAPCDASRIEGRWVTQPPAHPIWRYEFRYPHLRQWIEDFGVVIADQEYIYAPVGDSVFIGGTGGQRIWTVCFSGDSVCEYRRLMPGVVTPPVVRLRRE